MAWIEQQGFNGATAARGQTLLRLQRHRLLPLPLPVLPAPLVQYKDRGGPLLRKAQHYLYQHLLFVVAAELMMWA